MQLQIKNLEKKIRTVKDHIYSHLLTFSPIYYHAGDADGAQKTDFDDSGWSEFAIGQEWGGRDCTDWFRIPFRVPENHAAGRLAAILQPGRRFAFISSEGGDLREYEVMVYLDGQALQSIDVRRNEIPLWDKVTVHSSHLLALAAFSGLEAHRHRFEQADLVFVNSAVEDFYYNAKMIYETLLAIGEADAGFANLYNILQTALLKVNFMQIGQSTFHQSIADANAYLYRYFCSSLPGAPPYPAVLGLGHSHLDIAWKWQTRHSVHKAARTSANALRLIELYPEYRFSQSQAQYYQYVQEYYPELYSRIKDRIAFGQWEATGGMWVEADCNIPSGESLVRQFLYGKRYFRQELGVDCQVVWLPDAFGFCYSLPQIMKMCGMRYFMTTKLSWNQFCKFPHDTFWWQGLDGTRVLAYFISTPDRRGWNDYSVDLNPANLKNCWDNYKQKKENTIVLLSFGWGDGGGGPTREMLENGRRLQQISALPHFYQGKAETFFAECEQRVTKLPVWNDELYLQFHRGTYTSQAAIKKNNRRSEVLLHNAELFCSIDFLHSGHYPQKELEHAWKLVLLNQFHDILPGSSIAEVYQDSEREFAKVRSIGSDALQQACSRLAPQEPEADQSLAVFNGLSWPRTNLALFPHPFPDSSLKVLTTAGDSLAYQISADGRQVLLACQVPALGWQVCQLKKAERSPVFTSNLHISTRLLENRFFIIDFNERGLLTRLYDKRYGREVMAFGQIANNLQVFEDRPIANDAWDIDLFYQDKLSEITNLSSIDVIETGPVRGGISLARRFLNSTIRQNIFIYDEIPRIDFETEIDWQQHQTLLKVAFPLAVHSGRATYEIPFGSIERPTHWNTEWDQARFEVPGQRWADLSEGDYGVSLLNDCKYGYDIKDHVMRLTLLKSAIEPDPQADIGLHRFCYSLYPHQGDWRNANTVRMANEFNNPLFARFCTSRNDAETPSAFSFAKIDPANLIIDTIKKAEDSEDIIIRIYETFNQRGTAVIECAQELLQVWECNGLEEKQNLMECQDRRFSFQFRPFEIKTFMLSFKNMPSPNPDKP